MKFSHQNKKDAQNDLNGCQDLLLLNKLFMQDRTRKKEQLSMAWISIIKRDTIVFLIAGSYIKFKNISCRTLYISVAQMQYFKMSVGNI